MSSNIKNDERMNYILMTVFSIVLFYICVMTRHTFDYSTHTPSMEVTSLRPLLNPLNWLEYFKGYPLWHMTGHLIMRILNCPAEYAAGISSGCWCVLSYLGIIKMMRYLLEGVDNRIISVLVFALFIVAPVWLPWKNEYIVLHVGGINVWHNATNICGRAVGIYAFFCSMKLVDDIVNSDFQYIPTLKRCVLISVLYVISLIAKPSFAQTFAPAFGLLLIFYLVISKGRFLRQFLMMVLMAILPGLHLLTQYLRYFSTKSGEEGIYTKQTGEGILVVVSTIDEITNVLTNQVYVLLFPMVMVVIMILAKRKFDRYHAISWTMFLVGIICILCLKGAASGEMGWAYYIAAFMVFTVGIRDYLKMFWSGDDLLMNAKLQSALFVVATAVLIEQFVAGIYYLYVLIIMGQTIF